VNSYNDDIIILQKLIEEYQPNSLKSLLEAGCGSASRLNLENFGKIIGIDISNDQLNENVAIDEKILGDIQTYCFDRESFDVIICWDVLEHIENPKMALNNFDKSIKNNGLIVLAAPEPLSIKGLVTKLTPFSLHKLFYKKILKLKIEPFPTFLRLQMSREQIKKYFSIKNYSLLMDSVHLPYYPLDKLKRNKTMWILYKLLTLLVPSKYQHSDYILVFRKCVE